MKKLLGSLLLGAALIVGCDRTSQTALDDKPLPSSDEIRTRIDDALEYAFYNRQLTVQKNAAWQILHGVVAFRDRLTIWNNSEQVVALDYLLAGGTLNGWAFEPGRVDKKTGQHGLRALVEPGSKTAQGHPDQWLGYMALCGLKADTPIEVEGKQYTFADFLAQTEWDVPRNFTKEYSWTLMGLSVYRPSDYAWTASDGKTWSVEQLIGIEAEHDLNDSACGGSHRLTGMAMALAARNAEGKPIEGAWLAAKEKIDGAVETVRNFQNPDGTFSTFYFVRPASDVDLKEQLGTTGHTLEFLTWVLTDEELREPWITRSVVKLCDLFEKTEQVDLECGALYHAASALVRYRERIYGAGPPLNAPKSAEKTPATTAATK